MKTISKKTINTLREVPFKKQIVNYKNNANDWNPMPKEEVRYVTCHNTGGRGYSESYATNVANECNKGNAAPTYHFVVDHTKVIQLLPLNINGWHAGDNMGPGNMNSIGIEICQHYDGNIDTAMGKIEY